jgi:hypothetical protein
LQDSGRGSPSSELEWEDNKSSDAGENAIEQDRRLQLSYTDLDDTLTGTEHSEKLLQELDDSTEEMQSLIDLLERELKSFRATNLRCGQDDDTMSEEQDTARLEAYQEGDMGRQRSQSILLDSLTQTVDSTISLSEPDQTVIGVNQHLPPPVPPCPTASPTLSQDSGWSSLECSPCYKPRHPASYKPLSNMISIPGEERFATAQQLPKSPSKGHLMGTKSQSYAKRETL